MRPVRPSEIDDLLRRAEKLKQRSFNALDHFEVVPEPDVFAKVILNGQLDYWQMRYMTEARERARVAIAASRQSGKSTVTALFVAWCLIFIPNFVCLVASRSLRQAAHYLTKVREAVLAVVPRDAMIQLNRLSMELPNGSTIISIPCAQPDAGRGFSPHLIILDEAAFAPEDLFRAITPSLAATQGALHMLSSPNGRQGYFFEAFEGMAVDVFWSLRVRWQECPRITPEIAEIERVALGDLYFRQEFGAEFVSPLGGFFGNSGIMNLEDGEDFPTEDLELVDLEAILDKEFPLPTPTREDLQTAFDRADRVNRLLVD